MNIITGSFQQDLIPPVGEKHMLHSYNSPQCAEVTGHLFHRIPKISKNISGAQTGLQLVEVSISKKAGTSLLSR